MSTLREYIAVAIKNNENIRRKKEVQIRVLDKNEVDLFVVIYDAKEKEYSIAKNIYFTQNVDQLAEIDYQINVSEILDLEVIRILVKAYDPNNYDEIQDVSVKRYCVDFLLDRKSDCEDEK